MNIIKKYVGNTCPIFTPPANSKNRPDFIRFAMKRASEIDVARSEAICFFYISKYKRFRSLNEHRAKAMRAIVQAMLFHYNIITGVIHASVEQLSDECGLSTISKAGNKSITRASRLIKNFLEPLGFVRSQKKWDKYKGNYFPKTLVLTAKFFSLLDISEKQLEDAKKKQLAWANKNFQQNGEGIMNEKNFQKYTQSIRFQNICQYRKKKNNLRNKKSFASKFSTLGEQKIRSKILQKIIKNCSIKELKTLGISGLKKQVNFEFFCLRKFSSLYKRY